MAQADELARDIVVAWLSHNNVSFSLNDPEKIGEALGKIYTAVLQAVQGGFERHPPAPNCRGGFIAGLLWTRSGNQPYITSERMPEDPALFQAPNHVTTVEWGATSH